MLRPITFSELAERLSRFDVFPDSESREGTRLLRQYRMSVGTDKFYAVVYRGDDTEILPATQRKIIEYFAIPLDDWMLPSTEADSRDRRPES